MYVDVKIHSIQYLINRLWQKAGICSLCSCYSTSLWMNHPTKTWSKALCRFISKTHPNIIFLPPNISTSIKYIRKSLYNLYIYMYVYVHEWYSLPPLIDRWQEPPTPTRASNYCRNVQCLWRTPWIMGPMGVYHSATHRSRLIGYSTIFHRKGCNPKNPGPMCS